MFDFRNGKPLTDLLIPEGLSHAATSFVESLKINSITEKARDRRVVIKRRNVYGERAAGLINFYFRAAGIPIRYLSDVRDWRRWEARCFQMLNRDRFRAKVRDSRTVRLDKLPGDNLWNHMNRGTLTPRMLKSAGVFRRCVVPSVNWNFIARLRSIPRAKNGDLRLIARERDRECRRLNRGNVPAKIWQRRFLPECREDCRRRGNRFPGPRAGPEREKPLI